MKRRAFVAGFGGLAAATVTRLPGAALASRAHPKLGFSIDDLRLERWSRDRDYFIAAAKTLAPPSTCSRRMRASSARSRRSRT